MNSAFQSSEKFQLEVVLDQTINLAEELNLSEREVVGQLLERYQQLKLDKSSYGAQIFPSSDTKAKKFFDGNAGP